MVVITIAFVQIRSSAVGFFSSPDRQAEWGQWREAVKNQPEDSPVKRRVPKSHEPPTLVLMRDYFAMCLGAGLIFGSVLFYVMMVMIRGAFRSSGQFPVSEAGD